MIPLINNFVLSLIHIFIIIYASINTTFGEAGQKLLFFYHNYTFYIIVFILLNTLLAFFFKTTKTVIRITLFSCVLALLLYIGFYNVFNPY